MIEKDGGNLIACEPQEHDKIMVAIQAIRNFTALSLGIFSSQEKIDLPRNLNFSSPTFRLEIGLVSRSLTQFASMIADILLATSERQQAIERLSATYSELAQLVVRGDRDALIHKFQIACNYFAGEIAMTVEESHHVL
ncbi:MULTISPECIES: prephenate dehydrogenase dimerization domain-containing protein [Nostocales]|uniref:Prephenate dehydrogenase/arogenate dehydrogenase family protein n=3 Tax=Nostocales TaxID=1161 RepID=A0A8S9TCI4_9CYAN|nr:prephenate dehydrogenase dimerization domain-containing protein [Tolypothrix bouteillei]KAF3889808.1 prephenate dehydrogenase/arogenate dehydrogenase family protein [Tolypothrix bouteillei VB521301]